MKKMLSIGGLLTTLGLLFYLESSDSLVSQEPRYPLLYFAEDMDVVDALTEEKKMGEINISESVIPSLEYIHEKSDLIDGYMVETYREYEIYSDEQGNVMKKVPTSYFEFIRYRLSEQAALNAEVITE